MREIKTIRMLVATAAMAVFMACTGINPVKQAETFEQKAFALYGTYVVFQGKAAELVQEPAVPQDVKDSLRAADRVSYPAAESLVDAAMEVGEIRTILNRCSEAPVPDDTCVPTNEQRLANAINNLSAIYFRSQPVILNLVAVVKRAK